MGVAVFDNLVFDAWLTNKSQEILSKVDRERITTEEMLVLILKAQTNHFHHMDEEFRGEFRGISKNFEGIRQNFVEIGRKFEEIDQKFLKIDRQFEIIDRRFENIDRKFEKMWEFHKWQGGVLLALFAGLYLKLFLG